MSKTVSVIFDGQVFRPENPLDLVPNTRYDITLEAPTTAPATTADKKDLVKQHYTFINSVEVESFLIQHPELIAFLEEAKPAIESYFPNALLSVKIGPSYKGDMDSRLLLTIHAEGDADPVMIAYNDLKVNWWTKTEACETGLALILIEHPEFSSRNAWDVFEGLIGTVEAPQDWSLEHDHYIHGTPKRYEDVEGNE